MYLGHIANNRKVMAKMAQKYFFGSLKLTLIYNRKFESFFDSLCRDYNRVKLHAVFSQFVVKTDLDPEQVQATEKLKIHSRCQRQVQTGTLICNLEGNLR